MSEPLFSKQVGLLRLVHTTILLAVGVVSPDELQNKRTFEERKGRAAQNAMEEDFSVFQRFLV